MKFINAEFFYNSNELIGEYSYWWFLMGTLSENVTATDESSLEFESLRDVGKSYTITSNTDVILHNAYICGMLKAERPVISADDYQNNKGKVILTAKSSNEDSIIPFTVGQDHKDDGHHIDSLWLVRLNKSITNREEVSKFFPFKPEGGNATLTHIYKGVDNLSYDISGGKALIGYDVSSSNNEVVNAMNFSGFTVGESTITISGLVTEGGVN